MDYDFVRRRGVKDHIGIWVHDEAAKAACVGELAGIRMQGDEVDNRLDPRFDATCLAGSAHQYATRCERVLLRRGAYTVASQAVLGPDRFDLVFGREFASLGLREGGLE
jgi:hypothetical protein